MEWLDRLVSVMDIISEASVEGVSLTEILHETGIARATLHRMLTDMVDQGLVSQSRVTKRYCIGPRPMVWGGKYVEGQDPARLLSGYCDLLSERTGLYTFLSRYDFGEVYCIYTRKPGAKRLKYFVHIGQKMPLHCSAAAKAILAFRPQTELNQLLNGSLPTFNENTKVDRPAILLELETVKKTQVAFCRNELEIGVTTIATPIVSMDGVIFSISLIGASDDVQMRESELIRELLRVGDEAAQYAKMSR